MGKRGALARRHEAMRAQATDTTETEALQEDQFEDQIEGSLAAERPKADPDWKEKLEKMQAEIDQGPSASPSPETGTERAELVRRHPATETATQTKNGSPAAAPVAMPEETEETEMQTQAAATNGAETTNDDFETGDYFDEEFKTVDSIEGVDALARWEDKSYASRFKQHEARVAAVAKKRDEIELKTNPLAVLERKVAERLLEEKAKWEAANGKLRARRTPKATAAPTKAAKADDDKPAKKARKPRASSNGNGDASISASAIWKAVKNGAETRAAIAEKVGCDPIKLGAMLAKLVEMKNLKKDGVKRGTKYSIAKEPSEG